MGENKYRDDLIHINVVDDEVSKIALQQQPHHRNEAAIIIQNHCKRPLMNFLNLLMFEEISFFSLSMSHMKNLHSLRFFNYFCFRILSS